MRGERQAPWTGQRPAHGVRWSTDAVDDSEVDAPLVLATNASGGILRHLDLTRQALGTFTYVSLDGTSLTGKVRLSRRLLAQRRPGRVVTHGVAAGLAMRLARRKSAGPAVAHVEFWHGDPFYGEPARRRLYEAIRAVGVPPEIQVFVHEGPSALYATSGAVQQVLRNAIPEGPARTAERSASQAVFVGRFSPEKGIPELAHAWAATSEPWQLRLYGQGRLPELPARVASHGPTAAPLTVMATAQLVMLPSRTEASPYAALEAMSVGTPLVATRVGDVPDLLGSGCGWLAAPSDAASLGRSLQEATCATDEERAERGELGRLWLAQHRSFASWREEVRTLYAGGN